MLQPFKFHASMSISFANIFGIHQKDSENDFIPHQLKRECELSFESCLEDFMIFNFMD